jgi:mannan endo-1,4-beta-mannosidase
MTRRAAPTIASFVVIGLMGAAGCGAADSGTASGDGLSDAAPAADAVVPSSDGHAPAPHDGAADGGTGAASDGSLSDGGPPNHPAGEGGGGGQDAAPSPRDELLGFLKAISGKKTLSGEHNREASQGDFIQAMHAVTGHYPALWGGDFLYESDAIQNRPNVIDYLMNGWKGGAVIDLMYHACPPTQGESCGWDGGVLSALSDAQWSDLVTDGGSLNQIWKARLDAIAPYFEQLKAAGMAALFRPHHEMNQGVFWWGGRPGPNGTAALYRVTHDYLVKTRGLDNIVWVWSVQDIWDGTTSSWNFDAYNPGAAYWDVMSLDFYDGKGYTADKYAAMLAEAGSKPIAIGECQVLPTAGELTAQPRWVYFMGWAELVQQNDSNAAITAVYAAPNVLTQDRMPGW